MKKLLPYLLLSTILFSLLIASVSAKTYTNDDETNKTSSYSMDTIYEAGTYVELIETYNVEIDWDDLHWVFIYDGNITNPTKSVWLTKASYDSYRGNTDVNEFNHTVLNNISQYKNLETVTIDVKNNGSFSVNILATIEDTNNNENYTNAAGLQVSKANVISYDKEANLTSLETNAEGSFLVKPTAERFVNDSGKKANVTGEVKLTFTKAS